MITTSSMRAQESIQIEQQDLSQDIQLIDQQLKPVILTQSSITKMMPKVIYARNENDSIKQLISNGRQEYGSSHNYIYGKQNQKTLNKEPEFALNDKCQENIIIHDNISSQIQGNNYLQQKADISQAIVTSQRKIVPHKYNKFLGSPRYLQDIVHADISKLTMNQTFQSMDFTPNQNLLQQSRNDTQMSQLNNSTSLKQDRTQSYSIISQSLPQSILNTKRDSNIYIIEQNQPNNTQDISYSRNSSNGIYSGYMHRRNNTADRYTRGGSKNIRLKLPNQSIIISNPISQFSNQDSSNQNIDQTNDTNGKAILSIQKTQNHHEDNFKESKEVYSLSPKSILNNINANFNRMHSRQKSNIEFQNTIKSQYQGNQQQIQNRKETFLKNLENVSSRNSFRYQGTQITQVDKQRTFQVLKEQSIQLSKKFNLSELKHKLKQSYNQLNLSTKSHIQNKEVTLQSKNQNIKTAQNLQSANNQKELLKKSQTIDKIKLKNILADINQKQDTVKTVQQLIDKDVNKNRQNKQNIEEIELVKNLRDKIQQRYSRTSKHKLLEKYRISSSFMRYQGREEKVLSGQSILKEQKNQDGQNLSYGQFNQTYEIGASPPKQNKLKKEESQNQKVNRITIDDINNLQRSSTSYLNSILNTSQRNNDINSQQPKKYLLLNQSSNQQSPNKVQNIKRVPLNDTNAFNFNKQLQNYTMVDQSKSSSIRSRSPIKEKRVGSILTHLRSKTEIFKQNKYINTKNYKESQEFLDVDLESCTNHLN